MKFDDPVISKYEIIDAFDLKICLWNGVAYQHDLSNLVSYDDDYFNKYCDYEGTDIANRLNNFRRRFSTTAGAILDVGVGSLEFLKSIEYNKVYGFDLNENAIQELKVRDWWIDLNEEEIPKDVSMITLWDVFEHLPRPTDFLKRIPVLTSVCLSIPIFRDLTRVFESRHYRPGEHLTYWTRDGIRAYFNSQGFIEESESFEESIIGRESIASYRFKKVK